MESILNKYEDTPGEAEEVKIEEEKVDDAKIEEVLAEDVPAVENVIEQTEVPENEKTLLQEL